VTRLSVARLHAADAPLRGDESCLHGTEFQVRDALLEHRNQEVAKELIPHATRMISRIATTTVFLNIEHSR
jgi:hypothetical protein